MNRREFLANAALAAAGTALSGCDLDVLQVLNTGKEQLWGMNVHPYSGARGDAQIEVLRRMGIRQVRLTLGLEQDLAGHYLRNLAAEYVGLVSNYVNSAPNVGAWPSLVDRVVRRAPGLYCYEILNEPSTLMSAVDYVHKYLKPAYNVIKGINPAYQVCAGAPTGTSNGRIYFYEMTEAGADDYCDLRAAHIYEDNPEILIKGTKRPFLITESGVKVRGKHVDWYSSTMTHISGVLETTRVYWYCLMDDGTIGEWSIIGENSRPGAIEILSPLYDYIVSKYGS